MGTAWRATRDEAYADEVLQLIGLEPLLLPDVLGGGEAAGKVATAAARALGLRAGRPVGSGTATTPPLSGSVRAPASPW